MMIHACKLLDHLKAEARAGNQDALERIFRMLPQNAQAIDRIAERDRRIRTMAVWLRSELPGAKPDRLAHILEAAGSQVAARHQELHGDLFLGLSKEDCSWLVAEITSTLVLARWPKARRIYDIIKW